MRKINLAWALVFVAAMAVAQEKPYVLLVSFDGFRHDYVERFNLPNFKSFIREGSQAKAMIPSFPSKTFPNHYTLVTGLYPGHHGLVDNTFYDPERQEMYRMNARDKVSDPYYYGGTPLWKLAQQHGMKSASYFWVGSEIKEEGQHPDYYFLYDEEVPFEARIDQVADWLTLPAAERPHFITLYFSSPDHESHEYGPLADETRQTLLRMDSLLGYLVAKVRATKLPVNIILVSDHGMKEMEFKSETFIFLDELFDLQHPGINFANGGSQAHLYTSGPLQHDSLYKMLKKKEKYFTVLTQEEFPSSWHYQHLRAGDLMIVADPGFYIREKGRARFEQSMITGKNFGAHGFDPTTEKDMYGIFYAHGPNIRAGITVEPFENVHIYPLIAKILGLTLPEIDGKESVLNALYRK
jgi:alkaline phosphatase D